MNPHEGPPKRRVRFEDAAARLADHDASSLTVFRHGTLQVELSQPQARDAQTPHTRDEVYVVIRGTATFVHEGGREPCGPHDVLFAPAGLTHRFESVSEGFAVWVLFYGPEGGEEGTGDRRHGGDRRLETPTLSEVEVEPRPDVDAERVDDEPPSDP
jgi:mannose-6-phosphate isomerase-like protein (cupin superfamily)